MPNLPDPVRADSAPHAERAPQASDASLLPATKRILEMITAGETLNCILAALCAAIDEQNPDMMSMVMLMDADGQRLWPAAAPRVPGDWTEALKPLLIGESMGSCGTAAFRRERVVLSDIATDPLMSGLPDAQSREVALGFGLRAAWSQPLISRDNEVLGTFGLFHRTPRAPTSRELRLIEDAGHIALIAIEGQRSRTALQRMLLEVQASERELRNTLDAVRQTIVVLSPDGTVLHANQFLLDYAGLTAQDFAAPDFPTRFFHPDDWARLQDVRRRGLSVSEPFEMEWRTRHRSGQYRWSLIRYYPFCDERGRILRWYATGTDIDDRKRAEERVRIENLALRAELDQVSMFEEIVGSSKALRDVLAQVAQVASSEATVLLLGETGTGKELIARAIHQRSHRASRAFIRVNCAAIPPSLIASELFGHEKGAFTGALQRRLGRFEAADGGTIFLDEIGEVPEETQLALLRVLQEREIERVGGSHPISVDVRVLAATNRDLLAAVESGGFRRDLYYRLNVIPVRLPPLRERVDDVPLLVQYLVERYARSAGKTIRHVSRQTLESLQAYDWPGNVRELQNVIERAVVLCSGDTLTIDQSWLQTEAHPKPERPGRPVVVTLAEGEKALIEAALAEAGGKISGPAGAAAKLGIPRQTLESKIKALHVDTLSFKGRAPTR